MSSRSLCAGASLQGCAGEDSALLPPGLEILPRYGKTLNPKP